jgi:hypothetical protein
LELRDLIEEQNGRFLLVYVPTKEHITWSRIWDPVDVNNVLERTRTVTLSEGDHGRLQWGYDISIMTPLRPISARKGRLFDDLLVKTGLSF